APALWAAQIAAARVRGARRDQPRGGVGRAPRRCGRPLSRRRACPERAAMSRAVVLAAAAGGVGVFGAWEVLAALDGAGGALRRMLAPLVRAGRGGVAPSVAERRRVAALLGVALLAAGWLVAGPVAALLLAAGGPMSARAVVGRRRRRWRAELVAG